MIFQVTASRFRVVVVPALVLAFGAAWLEADRAFCSPQDDARQILEATGIQGGLVVHVGCGDGMLTAALRANDRYLVHGLDRDPANVEKARQHVRSLGLYGPVSVDVWPGGRLPYADNLVNLLVGSKGLGGRMQTEEITRVLAPGGVLCVKVGDKWMTTVKPRPDQIDEWTHFLHGPDNNAVAQDSVVGPPRHLQWVAGPKWARSHDHLASLSAAVTSGTAVFAIVDEGPTALVALPAKWSLVARDAFSGVLLWKKPIGPWEWHLRGFRSGPPEISRTLVAVGDRVYVTLGYGEPVTALDAATGQVVRTYEGTAGTVEIISSGGVLYLVAGERPAEPTGDAIEPWRRGVTPSAHHKRILAVRAETGEPLWKKADDFTAEVMPTTLAVGGGRVFFENPAHVICLDAKTGQEIWRAERPIARSRRGWSAPTLVVYREVVLSADRDPASTASDGGPQPEGVEWVPTSAGGNAPVGELIAFSATSGERLWRCPARECYNASVDVLVAGGLVWTGNLVRAVEPGITVGRDPLTGQIKRERPPDKQFFTVGMGHHRCYRNKATSKYLVMGRSGVEFIDLATGRGVADHWTRGTCQYGVMPANGLLYCPPHSCACYIYAKLNGFNTFAPERSPASGTREGSPAGRLQRGPAFGAGVDRSSSTVADPSAEWPTYRHDPARSGRTMTAVPPALKPSWQAALGSKLSTPVVSEGKVFLAQIDAHAVCALDAQNGKQLWSYTAGGRVDSPPTIYQGLALFGSADGCVYCLRASDGQLVWRFRAGPEDRRVVAYNQLESAWPVHGSILIEDGSAWFVAGRSIFIDGGMYVWRLEPATGKVLAQARMDGRDPATGLEPQGIVHGTNMEGALPDVLSSDGSSIYMRHVRLDRNLVEQGQDVPHLFSSVGFLDGSWWHRTYWQFGTQMRSGYGGWPVVGNQVPAGRLLVLDEQSIYGFGRDAYAQHGGHVGIDATTVFHYRPNQVPGTRFFHYRLFGMGRPGLTPEKPQAKPAPKAKRKPPARPPKTYRWTREVPVLVRAMVLADRTLFVAGPPDGGKLADLPAALEGRSGGLLWAVSTSDGGKLAEYPLQSPPVFDGMAAAGRKLYLSTTDGKVLCFAGR